MALLQWRFDSVSFRNFSNLHFGSEKHHSESWKLLESIRFDPGHGCYQSRTAYSVISQKFFERITILFSNQKYFLYHQNQYFLWRITILKSMFLHRIYWKSSFSLWKLQSNTIWKTFVNVNPLLHETKCWWKFLNFIKIKFHEFSCLPCLWPSVRVKINMLSFLKK